MSLDDQISARALDGTIAATKLANRIELRLEAFKAQIETTIFRSDIPIVGSALPEVDDEVLAFVTDLAGRARSIIEGIGKVRVTAQDIADAFAAAADPDLSAVLLPDGTVSVTFSHTGLLDLLGVEAGVELGDLGAGFALQAAVDLAADINAALTLIVDPVAETVVVDVAADSGFTMGLTGALLPAELLELGFLDAAIGVQTGSDGINLTFDMDLTAGGPVATLSGDANFGRHLETQVPSAILPSISADLVLGFSFDSAVMVSGVELAAEGIIGIENITLDLGGLADFLDSILGQIADIANSFPLGTVLDILTTPIPVINTIAPASLDKTGDGSITAADFVIAFGGESDNMGFVSAIEALLDVLETIDQLRGLTDTLDLGDLVLTGEATASFGTGFDLDLPGLDVAVAGDLLALLETTGIGDFLSGVLTADLDIGHQINIPLITDPLGTLGGILLNGFFSDPVTLVEWDLPPLDFSVRPSIPFNVGPLAFFIAGRFSGVTDFGVGYDTAGFSLGGLDVPAGFYITTLDGGRVQPFATLGFGMEAGGGVGVGVARVSIVGGVGGEVDLFLGGGGEKTRLSDIAHCLFDPIRGRIIASLEVEVKVGIGPLSVTERITIGETVLAQFNFDVCNTDFDPEDFRFTGTGLATALNSGILRLNVGANSTHRSLPDRIDVAPAFAALTDEALEALRAGGVNTRIVDEVFHVARAPVGEGGIADPDALAVSAFGVYEVYDRNGGFGQVRADGGSGNDRLSVDGGLDVAVRFTGGAGKDSLTGGALADVLDGGAEADSLVGNAGNDTLTGGAGDDLLVGGAGADSITGGDGVDEVDYSASTVGVRITAGVVGGAAVLLGARGEAEGDVLSGVELLKGSAFGDLLTADPLLASALQGQGGNDTLIGGAGNDLLAGGDGADDMRGGAGNDAVSYAFSDAAVGIDLDRGFVFGGEATGDSLTSIEIYQLSFHGDVFRGSLEQSRRETVYGFDGDDVLDGGKGADDIYGGAGDDTIRSRIDGDTLDGETGRDLLDLSNYFSAVTVDLSAGTVAQTIGGTTTDTLRADRTTLSDGTVVDIAGNSSFEDVDGGIGNDRIEGDVADNRLTGNDGDDTLIGGLGNDTLIGGTGADGLFGGLGTDLADFSDSNDAVTVNLANLTIGGGDAAGDSILGIENLRGGGYGDTLTGNALSNDIDVGRFGGGTDVVDGRDGIDRLIVNWADATDDLEVVKLAPDRGFIREAPFPGLVLVDFDEVEQMVITTGSGDDVVASIYDGAAVDEDELDHFSGDDVIATGAGNDTINAGSGRDQIHGGADDDVISRDKATMAQTFAIDGGSGTDLLNADLSYDIAGVTLTADATGGDFAGVNARVDGGGVFSGFEMLGTITTGNGRDVVTQRGGPGITLHTAGGADIVALDYGDNDVDAGASSQLVPGGGLRADVDTLILDYTGDTVHMLNYKQLVSPIGQPPSHGFELRADSDGTGPFETVIHTSAYTGFERLIITGTENGDKITGLSVIYDLPGFGDVLDGAGGRDTLSGMTGNDTLIGGAGADSMLGGGGDDLLIGGVVGQLDGIDTLVGGGGDDLFVLGDAAGALYGDLDQSATFDYARITDFSTARDRLQLSGSASDYLLDVAGGNTRILLAATGEMVAQIVGVTGLNLTAGYVDYVAVTEAPAAPAALTAGEALALRVLGDFEIGEIGLLDPLQSMIQAGLGDIFDGTVTFTDITVDGNLVSAASFSGAPFGLESGIVISTGQAVDLVGPNLVDGSDARGSLGGTDTPLTFERVGVTADGSVVFRADLSGLAGGIASLTLRDSRNGEGADGIYTGFDLDGVILSRDLLDAVGGIFDPKLLEVLDVFDFSPLGAALTAGAIRNPLVPGLLAGTINGMVDDGFARLGLVDFDGNALNGGAVSLGDGGSLTLDLTQRVDTRQPLYLYVAEAYDAGEELSGIVTVSDGDVTSDADASTDLGEVGAEDDRMTISTTFTLDLASGQEWEEIDLFNIVIVSEELPEFGGAAWQDLVDIRVNGLSVALLSDGRQATLQNLAASPFGAFAPDLFLNPVGTGLLASQLSADSYTTILRVRAPILDGVNHIEFTVADAGDGLHDTAVFIAALEEDTLDGGIGDNLLEGSSADDRITGMQGDDTAVGGHGWDTYVFAGNHIGQDVVDETGGSGNDTIQLLGALGPGDVTFTRGGDGMDDLIIHIGGTGSGQQIIVTDHYADDLPVPMVEWLTFAEFDAISLTGALTLTGSAGSDTGANRLLGSDLSERINGLAGSDLLSGLAGNDTLNGGTGHDTISGGEGNDSLTGAGGHDLMDGGDGDDSLSGAEGFDTLAGGAGNDTLTGGAGHDTLNGGDGDDLLNAGAADAQITGGAGRDSFVFAGPFGTAVITDFDAGADGDVLRLTMALQAGNMAAFLAASTQVGGAVVYDAGGDGAAVIILQGVTLAELTADNFAFV